MADNIGELKARFEKQKQGPDTAKTKHSPPLPSKFAKFEGNESPTVASKPAKKESPKLSKKVPLQPGQGQKGPSPATSRPNPPSKPKPNPPPPAKSDYSKIKVGGPSNSTLTTSTQKPALVSPKPPLKQQHDNVVKRPVPPPQSRKPSSNHHGEGRAKSMDVSKAAPIATASGHPQGRFSSSLEGSLSEEECCMLQEASKVSTSLKPRPKNGGTTGTDEDEDAECVLSCKIAPESTSTCSLPANGEHLKSKKPVPENGVKPHSKEDLDMISQKKQVARSIICDALNSPSRAPKKPHGSPATSAKPTSHKLTTEQDLIKPRSSTESPNSRSSLKHPLMPKPAINVASKPTVSKPQVASKPALPGAKPSLPGNKPVLGKPNMLSTEKPAAQHNRPVSGPAGGAKQLPPTPPAKAGESSGDRRSTPNSSPSKRPNSSPVKAKPLPPAKQSLQEPAKEAPKTSPKLRQSSPKKTYHGEGSEGNKRWSSSDGSPRKAKPHPPLKPSPSHDNVKVSSPPHKAKPAPPLKPSPSEGRTPPSFRNSRCKTPPPDPPTKPVENSPQKKRSSSDPRQVVNSVGVAEPASDFEETLTHEPKDLLPSDEDFEKTIEEDKTGDWVVVGGTGLSETSPAKKGSPSPARKVGAKIPPSPPSKPSGGKKPHPSAASEHSEPSNDSDSTSSSQKSLPPPPPGSTKPKPALNSIATSEEPEKRTSPKGATNMSALKNIFSSPASSPSTPSKKTEPPKSPKSPLSPTHKLKSSKFSALHSHSMDTPGTEEAPPSKPHSHSVDGESEEAAVAAAVVAASGDASPLIRIIPGSFSKKLPSGGVSQEGGGEGGRAPGDSANRGNVDSGFISEAPEDLMHGTSVESLPGADAPSGEGGVASTNGQREEGGASPQPLTPDVIEIEEPWDEARLEKAKKKRLNIATELLETEKTYSGRVRVVAVDFYDVVKQYNSKSKQSISESAIQQIFLNLKPIHQLSENILQELQQRMDTWSTNEALGDVISRLAPFLRLYSHYTSGFEDAIKTLTECTKKDRKFDAIVRDFESKSISTGLGLSSFMLEPIQRIPRYRLLLKEYLKYLPPGSPDRDNTEAALQIISEAADRSNDRIKELENSNVILAIQRSLVDYDDPLLAPHRSFIMKGTLLKSSRKTLSPRFFFLFSDLLLHTYPPEKDVYKFRNAMPIFGMKVEDPKVTLNAFEFNIYSTTRSLILVASSEEEKQLWISALQTAISDDMKKRNSLRRDAHLQVNRASNLFGTKAPIMVPDKSVTMCQGCTAEFTMIFRRHHCRACGRVVCSHCSQQKAYLPYLAKTERVCKACFVESKNPDGASGDECDSPGLPSPVGPRKQDSVGSASALANSVLNLKAYEDDAVIAGYVLCQEGKNKWTKMWYQIKSDCVLYKFKAHEDMRAVQSMPLLGYAVGSDLAQRTITLTHHSKMKNLCDTFKVDDPTAFDNWLEAIRKVIRMELGEGPLSASGTYPSHTSVTSPLTKDSRSLSNSLTALGTSSSRPQSQQSLTYSSSRKDSFSTVSSDSRPSSLRESSPPVHEGSPSFESSAESRS